MASEMISGCVPENCPENYQFQSVLFTPVGVTLENFIDVQWWVQEGYWGSASRTHHVLMVKPHAISSQHFLLIACVESH